MDYLNLTESAVVFQDNIYEENLSIYNAHIGVVRNIDHYLDNYFSQEILTTQNLPFTAGFHFESNFFYNNQGCISTEVGYLSNLITFDVN